MGSATIDMLIAAGLLGAVLGSFYNVVIARLPAMLARDWQQQAEQLLELPDSTAAEPRFNLVVPRSRCPHCQSAVAARDNIPLLSFALLRGRCRHCRGAISWRYPAVELASAALAAAVVWQFGLTGNALFALGLVGISLILLAIDAEHQLLPDALTLGLLWLGLIANLDGRFAASGDAIVGAVAGYGALWLLFWAVKWLTGRDAMGYGDFKYLAAIGAWFGLEGVLVGLLIAATLGSLVGIGGRLCGALGRYQEVAFGPYLAIAAVILLFFQPLLSSWLWGGLGG